MDNVGKHTLLCRVIEYAQLFQLHRRRAHLATCDIHDAIHALGYRQLWADVSHCAAQGVNVKDIVGDALTVSSAHKMSLTLEVVDPSEWKETKDNFRKRKISISSESTVTELSEKSKFYIEHVVNTIGSLLSSPSPPRLLDPPSQNDVLLASWFLGLHFADTLEKARVVPWQFVRHAVWYLQHAMFVHANRAKNLNHETTAFPSYLSEPWVRALKSIPQKEIECESENQKIVIQRACLSLVSQLEY